MEEFMVKKFSRKQIEILSLSANFIWFVIYILLFRLGGLRLAEEKLKT